MFKVLTTIMALVLVLVLGISASAESKKHKQLAKEAKITKQQAQETALKQAPGKIIESDLEREGGKLLYSFDIKTDAGIKEVQIDAIDGKILKVETETKEAEAKEQKEDHKQAQAKKSK